MKVYSYDYDGYFTCETNAQPNPRKVGDYLIPADSVTEAPPALTNNEEARLVNGEWEVVTSRLKLIEIARVNDEEAEKDRQFAETNAALLETVNDQNILLYEAGEDGKAVARDPVIIEEETALIVLNNAISDLHDIMVKDIYDQMEQVFGTRDNVSATALAVTCEAMSKRPDNFIDSDIGLNSSDDVLTYASSKLVEMDNYCLNRLKRIEKFRVDKDKIKNG